MKAVVEPYGHMTMPTCGCIVCPNTYTLRFLHLTTVLYFWSLSKVFKWAGRFLFTSLLHILYVSI